MAIQLTRASDSAVVTLSADAEWTDEFEWSPTQQRLEYTLTGALIVEEAVRKAGRPITLGGDNAWMQRADLLTLDGWKAGGDEVMTLALADSRSFSVHFRHGDTPVSATPLQTRTPALSTDWYRVVVRLLEV